MTKVGGALCKHGSLDALILHFGQNPLPSSRGERVFLKIAIVVPTSTPPPSVATKLLTAARTTTATCEAKADAPLKEMRDARATSVMAAAPISHSHRSNPFVGQDEDC